MGESTLRLGFVGTGVIAWAHALSLRGLARAGLVDAEIALVHDRDATRADEFAARNHAKPAGSADEVAEGVDAVYVCTTTKGHLPAVEAACAAGRPVFCEKPLARSLDEALRLARAVETARIPFQVGLVLRSAPLYRKLARLVAGGELGRPMAAIFRDDQFFPVQGHYASTWRGDAEEAGSGALLEHAIHDVDIVRHCFGEVDLVTATVTSSAGHDRIEDTAVAMLRAGDVPVSLVSVWHQVLTRGSTRRAEVFFERGFVSFDDDFAGPLSIETASGTDIHPCTPPDWVTDVPVPDGGIGLAVRPYIEENRAFVDAVTSGATPSPGLGEALAAHRVVDACYRSSASGGTVEVSGGSPGV